MVVIFSSQHIAFKKTKLIKGFRKMYNVTAVVSPGHGCQSFRLQVDLPTSRSFRLHDQVVSPTQFESIRLH